MKSASVKIFLLLMMALAVPSEVYSEKRISVRSYSPVVIHSSRVTKGPGPCRRCVIDADFRNFYREGIWIIFGSPADVLKRGRLIFKGEGPAGFTFSTPGSGYSLITISRRKGEGFTGIYLEPGAEVRIKEFVFSVLKYPGTVRIITARALKVNGEMPLEKWIAGLNKDKKVSVESLSLTLEGLKKVEAAKRKAWIYPIGNDE
jgi:hypothetical protein